MSRFNWWRESKLKPKLKRSEALKGKPFLLQQIEHGDYDLAPYLSDARKVMKRCEQEIIKLKQTWIGGSESLTEKLDEIERKHIKRYKNYAGDIKADVVLPSLRDDGSIDSKKLFPRLAALEFRYYADAEDWDGLIAVNHKKDYILLSKDRSFDSLVELFATSFKLTAPNTKPKSTVQDSLVAYEFKG